MPGSAPQRTGGPPARARRPVRGYARWESGPPGLYSSGGVLGRLRPPSSGRVRYAMDASKPSEVPTPEERLLARERLCADLAGQFAAAPSDVAAAARRFEADVQA